MSKFKKGDRVIYKKNNISKVVVIRDVHFDDAPNIYYTIIDSNKFEKQTTDKYLIKKLSPYTVFDNQQPKLLVAIQTHSSEIHNGRFEKFIRANHTKLKTCEKIVLFIDKTNDTHHIENICKKINVSIIEIDETSLDKGINYISNMFFNIVTYDLQNYQYLLLLETDCKLASDWYSTIINDIKNRKFWIYGSTSTISTDDFPELVYNISDEYPKPVKINSVAIYNRSSAFVDFLYEVINVCLSSQLRYDVLLSNRIFNLNPKMLLDSPYICDISESSKRYYHFSNYKPYTRILHQKF